MAMQGRIVGDDRVAAASTRPPLRTSCTSSGYLSANCFGDHRRARWYQTSRLASCSRSRCSSPWAAADAQVRGHVNGNLRVGNTRATLLAVLTVLVPFIGYPRTLNGLAALNDITRS